MNEKHVHKSDKDRHEFEEMVKKGTKAWDGTPDDWVDDLRGGVEKQEFECPRCGHCCQQVVDDLIAKLKEKDQLIKLLKEEVGFAERGYTKMGRNDG